MAACATILVTGATDGIGLATAERLALDGHHVLLHGRNAQKTKDAVDRLQKHGSKVDSYLADFSQLGEVCDLAQKITEGHAQLDVVINNAGVLKEVGADILCRAALSDEFANAAGQYFDNDTGGFADPHPDALDPHKCQAVVGAIEEL